MTGLSLKGRRAATPSPKQILVSLSESAVCRSFSCVGQQCYGEISECEADVTIELGGNNGEHYAGGIVGSLGKANLIVKDCITKGKYFSTSGTTTYMFGGIIGAAQNVGNIIQNSVIYGYGDIGQC